MYTSKVDYREVLLVGGLTIVACLTRIYGLNEWALVHDEIPTVRYAAERSTSLVNPAYYNLVLASFSVFGVTEWAARLPSMLLGMLSIPMFYVTWRQVFGRNVAFIGALIAIFSSWLLWHSQFSRFYTGVFLFGSLSFYLYYRALTLDSIRYLIWAVVANVAGVLFHVTSVMVVASCGAYSILVLVWRQGLGVEYSKRIASAYLGVYTVLGLIALPFFWGIADHRASGGVTFGDKPPEMILQLVRRTQLPVALCAFFGFILLLRRHLSKGIYLGIGIIIPVTFALVASGLMNTRGDYVIYSLPLVFLAAAFFLDQVGSGLSSYRLGYWMAPIILMVLLLPAFLSHYTGKRSLDVREAVAFVKERFQDGDTILSSVREFEYYAENAPDPDFRTAVVHFVPRNWKQAVKQYIGNQGRIWIVLHKYRKPLPPRLEQWLLQNGALVWRDEETRIDYLVNGYQVFLVKIQSDSVKPIAHRD